MKEDILEQIVDDWLLSQKGTFTKHNLKYRPDKSYPGFNSNEDSNYSDIDVVAIHTNKKSLAKVSVFNCKSWQDGFNPDEWYKLLQKKNSIVGGKKAWKYFRELVIPKWGKAFAKKILDETNSKHFTYHIVISKYKSKYSVEHNNLFEDNPKFINNLKYDSNSKVKIKILPFENIWKKYKNQTTRTLEATELGRLIQILKASGVELKK